MIKKHSDDHIISAGEISAYVICPEAWNLRSLKKVKNKDQTQSILGSFLHTQWTKEYDTAFSLGRKVRLLSLLIILTILLFILLQLL